MNVPVWCLLPKPVVLNARVGHLPFSGTQRHSHSWLMQSYINRNSTSQQSQNQFVETALAYALSYVSSLSNTIIHPALITILADTDYYSNPDSPALDTAPPSKSFHNFNVPLNKAHKTGLGSSAALVTAFTAAIVGYYIPTALLDVASESGQSRLHNLAQAAHCAAQGKIGSGFDIAAAVYGSCIYRRFSPRVLEGLGEVGQDSFSGRLQSVVEDGDPSRKWDVEIEKAVARIPSSVALIMCDVSCGSQTVGMVKKVLEWKNQKIEESSLLWATLQTANEDFLTQLQGIAFRQTYSTGDLDGIRNTMLTMRSLIREMSEKANVPIEPPVQTALIDACSNLPGVVGGVVPGAGGYDAIALLVENRKEVINGLSEFLSKYHAGVEDKNGPKIGDVRLLGVKQENYGIKVEDPSIYGAWL